MSSYPTPSPTAVTSTVAKPDLVQQVLAARRVSTPIVGISTPDPAATIEAISGAINGKAPKIEWDVVRGFTGRGQEGRDCVAKHLLKNGELDDSKGNPTGALMMAANLPGRLEEDDDGQCTVKREAAVLFIHLAARWTVDPGWVQACWLLRDQFKADQRMLVLLSPSLNLPAELAGDVVTFDEPLPDATKLTAIVNEAHEAAGLDLPTGEAAERAVEAIQGLPAFAAEQVTAMSLTKSGVDLKSLWERKRVQIEQTPGLRVFRGGERFEDIGGVEIIKSYLGRLLHGHARPNAIVFIDEIEKMLAGTRGDTSGVTQDQLGSLLSYMQDHNAAGLIFIGPPGAAKSAIAKAAGNEAGVPTIQLDLGAAKGSLVGQSEAAIRNALKVVTAVSNGKSLWIATCNSISELPPELRRRFTLGTFFFDLPTRVEREAIWGVYLAKYGLIRRSKPCINEQPELPADEGWTGAEIKQCCDIAWRLGCSLVEAAQFVVPVAISAADQLERLRTLANGRFLSASQTGVYRNGSGFGDPGVNELNDTNKTAKSRRKLEV